MMGPTGISYLNSSLHFMGALKLVDDQFGLLKFILHWREGKMCSLPSDQGYLPPTSTQRLSRFKNNEE